MVAKSIAVVVAFLAAGPAFAQQISLLTAAGSGIKCTDFRKNADGSWTPLVDMVEKGPGGTNRLAANTSTIRHGVPFSGVDVAAALSRQCH